MHYYKFEFLYYSTVMCFHYIQKLNSRAELCCKIFTVPESVYCSANMWHPYINQNMVYLEIPGGLSIQLYLCSRTYDVTRCKLIPKIMELRGAYNRHKDDIT